MQLQPSTTVRKGKQQMLDVNRVAPKLYFGSAPRVGSALTRAGFDVVLLCAREYQPRSRELPGVLVVHCGIDNSLAPTEAEIETAIDASRVAATAVMDGKRVLISCWMGKNRSGLVMALTLMRLYGLSGPEAVQAVQAARPGALFNPAFVSLVEEL